jgi:hypothetical protein
MQDFGLSSQRSRMVIIRSDRNMTDIIHPIPRNTKDFDPLPTVAKQIIGLPYGKMLAIAHGLRDRGVIIADIPDTLLAQAIAHVLYDWAEAQRED